MIVVEMGDEHRVDATQCLDVIERPHTPQVGHTTPEYRIGEEPHAVDLEEDGAVAYPGYGIAHESRSRSP